LNFAEWLPARANSVDVNKGTFGHVFVVGGSPDYTGAPILTAEASARTGAGKVSLLFPSLLAQVIVSRLSPVIITKAIETDSNGFFTEVAAAEILSLCEAWNASVVALGPGLGREKATSTFVEALVETCPCPMVIDADALTLLARTSDHGAKLLRNRTQATILTPHPGELASLLGVTTDEIQSDRPAAVQKVVQKFECVVVLKGFQTLVADSLHGVSTNSTGNPGLATGGTGDVLTGIIAGLIAQGLTPWRAAVAGVHIHGLAAELAAKEIGGVTGMIATDLQNSIPRAIAQTQKSN